ncbi:type II toxin-antitoxin system RelE/ParE family toxin (plasmid) [Agrobacterium tumefaciens]|uniref:type II toxin-antitoxin system RelE/ParE family toxin n=1 Tax=Agrobacterium tumefaciens TaxID=358 RepID=UPI0015737121|nr:type II toxin-antitoxin system RelE/ParE family toxin [Agrobacterium tumefaciens]NSY51959.1 type II toxin-antitoxin system RelE/ParE family toxin [Agrobacterium tumefaciens]WCK16859.1 type II toxin-antitoxin system RelE/ParE family toxin [Agrobacterium tumefaciens]
MIRSFKNRLTSSIDDGSVKKGFPADLVRRAQQLLTILDAATTVEDLRSPPGNRLEKLFGDREGQHSIRINKQWRICFVWTEAGPDNVEITDYH